MIGIGAVTAAAAGVAMVVVVAARHGGERTVGAYDGALAPAVRQRDGSVAMAAAGVAKPVLELYEDFQCPACLSLEERQGGTIKELAAQGKARVVYRPFQLFQQEPLMSNSRRAANAAACAPAGRWVAYHDKLYANQPEEGTVGFTTPDLIRWAAEVGIRDAAFGACVRQYQRMKAVDQASAHAGRAGVNATPYLALNGAKVGDEALDSPDALKEAVADAAAGRPVPRRTAITGTLSARH
ncbi:DsbA family protein [Actinomadura fibrosa]|uniref:DsbA family protein n=1 Tax=Actinomadura fibrosa TaxID=111802 RepID=A0ABW2XMS9_9ACTN|nr:thioredoxin domain-containing protein [Actinomadura fibrosa]